ncbi:phosphonate metabolism transcriptional regulator PhnF [Ciceribacter ferrooxidans]|nr:phosphonate metabolism transcriptional regulator PhnF [Ciceribacter ferrooxidans]
MDISNNRMWRDRELPVWRQIEADLEVDVQTGVYGAGERLPSEHELTAKYGVNRHTVRQALASLAQKGIVKAHQGKGVFVADEPFEYRLDRNAKWSEVEKRFDGGPGGRLLDSYEQPANQAIARTLNLDVGTPLIVTETLRTVGPGIATYGYHMFAKRRFDGIAAAFEETASFTQALARFGVDTFFRASTWIDCRMPRPREAAALAVSVSLPVMIMTYVDTDSAGTPILYGHGVFPKRTIRIRIDT